MQCIKNFSQQFLKTKPGFSARRSYIKRKEYPYTMNDLPSPEGDYTTLNNERQKKYNMHLAGGIGFFIATFGFGFATNMFVLWHEIPENIHPPVDCYRDVMKKPGEEEEE